MVRKERMARIGPQEKDGEEILVNKYRIIIIVQWPTSTYVHFLCPL